MKRRYKKSTIFVHHDEPMSHFIEILNRKGADGWEAISAWADDLGNYVLLKKAITI
jgi:NAD(P)H-hydrate repair Nnr-like enzyme with NAD(P)H-hydrate dehydratase domain